MKTLHEWVTQLNARQLSSGDIQLPKNDNKTPWYLRVFSGFCGWLAAWFLMGFLAFGMTSLMESPVTMVILGGLLIAAASAVFKQKGNDFIEQMGLAISMAGQLFVAFGLFSESSISDWLPLLMFTALQAFLAVIMPNYLHRLLSAYFATVTLALLLATLHLSSFYSAMLLLMVAFIWLNEFTITRHVSALQAIGYGTTVGLIQFKTSALFGYTNTWEQEGLPMVNVWLDEGLNTLVLLFVLHLMMKRRKLALWQRDKRIAWGLLGLLLIANLFANGIVCGIVILLIGYATQHRALVGLGIVATLINLSSYYYLLDLSLLHKSLLLMITGGSCLLVAFVWQKFTTRETANEI